MPRILDLVKIRPEVLAGELHGIIRLSDVLSPEKPDAFEKSPERVLSATYPSEAMRLLLHRLGLSLSDGDTDRKGNFIIAGGYGSGKSHLLLMLYHVLNSPEIATHWLQQHEIEFRPPEGADVVLMPMHQMRLPNGDTVRYLWEPIFHALGYEGFNHDGSNKPTSGHLHEAVAGRQVFLIIDEIERWYGPMPETERKKANEAFLQVLTEFCEDPANGMVAFVTLLRIEPAVADLLERPDRWPEDMTRAPDKREIVLHRLIESVDGEGAAEIASSYVDQYRGFEAHLTVPDFGAYREDMARCYPFHPETIDVVLERYSSVASRDEGSYQNSRGALALMAELLKSVSRDANAGDGPLANADLLLPGDVSIASPSVFARLSSLDAKLVEIAHRNLAESEEVPLADGIISTVLLHSLGEAGQERKPGAQLGDVLLGTVRPQGSTAGHVNPNTVLASMEKLDETAQNMHREENPSRWVFRADVNIQAQINRRAKTKKVRDQAPDKIRKTIEALVPGNVFVFPDADQEIPDHKDITIVVSTGYLESNDVLARVYAGKQFPNGLVVVSPRDRVNVMEHPSVLSLACRTIAANEILSEMLAVESPPDILRQVAKSQDLEKEIGGLYGRLLAPIHDPDTDGIEFRAYEVELRKGSIMQAVEERGTASSFEKSVMSSVRTRADSNQPPPTVGDIYDEFYRRRHYPKPVARNRADFLPVDGAIRKLVSLAKLEVIYGGGGKYEIGKDPGVPDKSWFISLPVHEVEFDVLKTVQGYLKARGTQGATVDQVRAHCREKAAGELPDVLVRDATIDTVIVDLVSQHQVETPHVREVPTPPLAGDLLVRCSADVIDGGGGGVGKKKQLYTIPHLPAGAAKNRIMTDIPKTDKLSEVAFSVTQKTTGKELVGQFGEVLGVQAEDIVEGTELSVEWDLKGTSVTNRDGLVSLLDRLPTQGGAQVSVSLKRESPKPSGGQE